MYKAIDNQNEDEIIILDSYWEEHLDQLRKRGQRDELICQECRQPVRVHAGKIRRWHFSHKSRRDCPYGDDSPELLQARAVLYKWLVQKYGQGKVILEKRTEAVLLPRAVDCWIDREDGPIVYWIIDKGLETKLREHLQHMFERMNAKVNWVFVAELLRNPGEDTKRVVLNTTQRDLMHASVYDQIYQGLRFGIGKSLHFLDYTNSTITTYRFLRQIHGVQIYEGHRLSHALVEMLIAPKTGEFVHLGEHAQWQQLQQEQAPQSETLRGSSSRRIGSYTTSDWLRMRTKEPKPSTATKRTPPTCQFCGQQTDSWWHFDGHTNTCKCTECQRKGRT